MPETSGSTGRTPETHVIDFRAAEHLLAARDPRGAVKLLDGVIAAHPENTAARLLRARAFFAAAQLRPAELEFTIVLEREPDNAFALAGRPGWAAACGVLWLVVTIDMTMVLRHIRQGPHYQPGRDVPPYRPPDHRLR